LIKNSLLYAYIIRYSYCEYQKLLMYTLTYVLAMDPVLILGVLEPSQIFLNSSPKAMEAIWVELVHKSLQKFHKAAEVHVFMGMEQPANFREERGLDEVRLDVVSEVLHIRMEAFVEVLWGEL